MAIIGVIIGLIGAALGVVAGVVGGLVGVVAGLLGGSLAFVTHLFPVVLISIGIIWLVKGSNPRKVTGVRADRGIAVTPQSPYNPR